MLPQPSPQPNGSDEWQPQTRASHRPPWGTEPLGRAEATGYLPPNADKQGQPVTEQKGGSHRQKENNKKAHLNHSSESQARQSTGKHTGSGEKDTCFSGRGLPGSVWTLTRQLSGMGCAVIAASMTRSGRPQLRDRATSAAGCGCPEWALVDCTFLSNLSALWLGAVAPKEQDKELLWAGCSAGPARLTQFQQPAFSVWVEEGVCQVIAIVFWDLKRLILDTFIQVL